MRWTLCQKVEKINGNCANDEQPKDCAKWRDCVGFWILGMCNNYGYVVMLSAAHDIIKSLNPSDNVSYNRLLHIIKHCIRSLHTVIPH